jgi:hypothetical protein
MFLFMYFDYTKTVDPHTIITIVLIFWLYFIFCLSHGFEFSMFDSLSSHFLLFYLLYLMNY